jgi:hypothetical protein
MKWCLYDENLDTVVSRHDSKEEANESLHDLLCDGLTGFKVIVEKDEE